MTDIALIFKADTSQLQKASTDLDKVAVSGQSASNQINNFSASTSSATKTINQWGAAVPKATQSTQGLFGSIGNLVNKLKPGQEEMAGFGRKAGQAGIQIQQFAGQVQMGTSASVALSQQAADLGFVLGFPLLGAVTGLAAGLAGPLLDSLVGTEEEVRNISEEIDELIKDFDNLTAAQQRYVRLETSNEIAELQSEITKLKNEQESLLNIMQSPINMGTDQLKQLGLQYAQVSSDIDTKTKKLIELKGSTDDNIDSVDEMIAALRQETAELGLSSAQISINKAERAGANKEQLEQLRLAIKESEARRKELKAQQESERALKAIRTEYQNQVKASKSLIDRLKQQNDTFGMSRAEVIRYNAAIAASEAPTNELSVAILAEAEALAVKTENMEAARLKQQELDDSAKESAKIAEESAREYEQAFNTLSDNITDAIMDFRSLGDVATAVAEQIKRAFVQNAITNPLLSMFGMSAPGSASGGLSFGSLFSGGGFNPSSLLNMGGGNSFLTNTLTSIGDFLSFGSAGTAATGSLSAGAGGSHALDFAGAGPSGLGSGSGLGLQGGLAGAATVAAFAIPAVMSIAQLFSGGTPRLTFGQGEGNYRNSVNTAFGQFGVVGGGDYTKDVSDATIEGFLQVIKTVDQSIASVLSPSAISNVTASLSDVSRFLGTWEQYLGEGESITHQYTTGVIGRSGADPVDQIISRYETVLSQALPKVFADQLLEQTDDLEQFAVSTVSTLDQISISSKAFNATLDELSDSYSLLAVDGESALDFFSRANAQYINEMNLLAQEIGLAGSAIGSLNNLGISIRESLLSDEELYGKLELQAETLAQSIDTLTDPTQVANAVAEIQSITSRAFGLLDEAQIQEMGGGIADFIDEVTAAASTRTAEIAEQRQEEISSIDNLASSTQNMATAVDSFQLAVDQMGAMISEMRSFITSQGGDVTSYNL